MMQLNKINATEIKTAIELLLTDMSYKDNAKKISQGFKNCAGPKGAADKILQTCK